MKAAKKMRDFLDRSEVKWATVAKSLGISQSYFYQFANGNFCVNPKYWKAIVELTSGQVSLSDLLEDYIGLPEVFTIKPNGRAATFSFKKEKGENDVENFVD